MSPFNLTAWPALARPPQPRNRRTSRTSCMGRLLISLSLALATGWAGAASPVLDAPNVVTISPQLTTSGQPTVAALRTLGAQGYGADIYLAPPTVSDAVPDEAAIVQRQGLVYLNIPIRFDQPSAADFDAFVAALAQVRGRKVLVHCQINLRASSMVFLHRVIVGQEDPEQAYAAVAKVWSPDGPWRRFIVAMLRQQGLTFEPY
jgi:protein tyrosine phosphatase (PTP) superfamily phosphohydrolase (DUF442 family)